MNDTKFDYAIHYLRGFAMINIVLFHILLCSYIYDSDMQKKYAFNILFTLFSNSTNYLLFISGFLFYKTNQRINIKEFYKKKLFFIVCPYILTSLLFVLISHARYIIKGGFCAYLTTPQSFWQFVQYIIDGRISGQFWFIPVICIIFLACPLICFINLNDLKRILCICIFFPILFYKIGIDFFSYKGLLESIYTIFHCFGVFLAGTLYFFEKKRVDFFIKKYIKLIAFCCLFVSIFIFVDTDANISRCNNLYVLQKYLILACMLYFFKFCNLSRYTINLFSIFAKYSFAIYFWHIFVVYFIGVKFYIIISSVFTNSILTKFIFCIFSLAMSLLFCILLKRITGKYSRYIIGI